MVLAATTKARFDCAYVERLAQISRHFAKHDCCIRESWNAVNAAKLKWRLLSEGPSIVYLLNRLRDPTLIRRPTVLDFCE